MNDRPFVVAHVAVSVDGATTGFQPDLARFYGLAATWEEDVTLAGSDTILAQEAALDAADLPGPKAGGPVLAVVDGRGRVSRWKALREAGHWSDVVGIHAESTPPRTGDHDEIVTGADRVDLAAALAALGRRGGVRTVRVDSGGALIGALLRAGLLDEVSCSSTRCWPGRRATAPGTAPASPRAPSCGWCPRRASRAVWSGAATGWVVTHRRASRAARSKSSGRAHAPPLE